MKRITLFIIALVTGISSLSAGGYEVGDKASDFKLENIDGSYISLTDYKDARGFVVIFTCNGCPYAMAYQDRIIEIDRKYKKLGYPVIAINPNDIDLRPDDSMEAMKQRAREKGYTFPYLKDKTQEVCRMYGATRTPHVYVLTKDNKDLRVDYIGAIDDNYQDAGAVKQPYLADALDDLLAGKKPDPGFTKAIGCTIKTK